MAKFICESCNGALHYRQDHPNDEPDRCLNCGSSGTWRKE